MTSPRSLAALLLAATWLNACTRTVTQSPTPIMTPGRPVTPTTMPVSWGIPGFFEVGPEVRLDARGSSLDTTGWPAAVHRTLNRQPRTYLSSAADDQSSVFLYTEPDPNLRLRRYALVVPEPKSFSTNGEATAFWGRSPLLMNFALGAARSFGSFTRMTASGTRQILPVRARLEPGGVNPQESENVYELEDTRLDVFEHKGLVPGAPLSYLEFTVCDRNSTTDDAEPAPVDAALAPDTLKVALIPLRELSFLHRRSFESSGYRVVLGSDASGLSYFLATPSEARPRWGFGEASTDLTVGRLEAHDGRDAGPGSAAALELSRPAQGWFLSGTVRNESEIEALLARGESFRARVQAARRALLTGATQEFAVQAARTFLDAHRSRRVPGTLTRFAYGDAPQPANSTNFSAGLRYGQDLGSALRGLTSVQRASKDATLLHELADLAESSLAAMLPSGATFTRSFEQLALLAEHDENDARDDVFMDNGSLAVAINHRRLWLASAQTHSPAMTWGAFGAVIDGHSSSVDEARYEFSIDSSSLPRALLADQPQFAISRLFTPNSGAVRIRETAELRRGFPAVSVRYQLENRGDQPAFVGEARLTLADFIDYGTGANEKSQGRYGLGHVADGVHLPIGFWMEGMKAPLWSDSLLSGELDLTEQYKSLGARFMLVFAFDRAQLYFLGRAADRLLLYNGPNGLSRLEARYALQVTLPPQQSYELPPALSYTLRAPLASVDGDGIPDQLQELAPLWTRLVAGEAPATRAAQSSLDTDSGQAELVYSWILSADLLETSGASPAFSELGARLRQNALRGSNFALSTFNELRNRNDLLPSYANDHDYGFHLAIFDWAYRETCDARYRDALLTLANDLVRPAQRGGLQISDPKSPSYGGYLSTQQARASGPTRVGDQGIRLWALRIAYERTGDPKYRRSAELFLNHWLRLDPVAHAFTGTVFTDQRYRDADVEQERSPLGHFAMLAGLKAWSDLLPNAKRLYSAGLSSATARELVHRIGLSGPRRLLVPREALADFSDDAELGGSFLWATTFDPNGLRGRFAAQCRRTAPSLASSTGSN
ncbi:MAG TPA: hypothetical protein VER11_01360 [Polyangiaceae bacterium]|nr:hypothetical protein [Polyangiaceae bacterium]